MFRSWIENLPPIPFVRLRHAAYIISALLLALGLTSVLLHGGLRYGVDFSGGVAVHLQFAQPVDDETIKDSLRDLAYPGLTIQRYGDGGRDYLIRFTAPDGVSADELRDGLGTALGLHFTGNPAGILRMDVVGPKVGADLRNSALEAVYYSVLLITVYISGRFERRWGTAAIMAAGLAGGMYVLTLLGAGPAARIPAVLAVTLALCWKLRLNFALGAVAGLLHDVLITMGLLSLLGKEIDLNIVAAVLTLIGYSLNDTIIIYDRIRENLRRESSDSDATPRPLDGIIDASLNQTLGRTVMTSLTTLAAVLSLFVLGGGAIHDFALTMLIGVVVGTFSSMFVSSPILLALGNTEQYAERVQAPVYAAPGKNGVV